MYRKDEQATTSSASPI